ncbi:MAG: dTDP-4-dehydrorhamnose 3,5-epimerase [Planctomycetes bacterium]|nr:dTDP-4-dehydrorhamnose 3,5-epimerase [Planctomycetota bacterium]
MKITRSELEGVLLLDPPCFGDSRGFFMELWNEETYKELGFTHSFLQDNLSRSAKGVLRGLHYQNPHAQGKLVSVLEGEVYDVALDIRRGSPTFGKWEAYYLSDQNKSQLYVPPGFAHGFVVVSDSALFTYKCTDLYHPECEKTILWSDPDLNIPWPVDTPLLSKKDKEGIALKDMPEGDLPNYGDSFNS